MKSQLFNLNFRDILIGLGLAVGSAVLITVQGALSAGTGIDWVLVLKVAEGALVSYLLKNFFSDGNGKVMGKV